MKPDEWELAGWRYFSKVERSSYWKDPPKKERKKTHQKKRENTHKKREKDHKKRRKLDPPKKKGQNDQQKIDFDFGKMILII